jgi:hypothetical protein
VTPAWTAACLVIPSVDKKGTSRIDFNRSGIFFGVNIYAKKFPTAFSLDGALRFATDSNVCANK